MNRRGFFARVAAIFVTPAVVVKPDEKAWGVSPYSKCMADFKWWSHSIVLQGRWEQITVTNEIKHTWTDNWGER